MLLGLQSSIQMETLPEDISRLAEELLQSDLLADFQVKMIKEWHDESMAQRNHMRHMAQTMHLTNIHPFESDELLRDHPDFADLIRRGGMGPAVSPSHLVASYQKFRGSLLRPSGRSGT